MNRKGIELSVNFLVVIILSLVLFGAGMFIFAKIINVSSETETKVSENIQMQLDAAMDNGGLVVIPRQRVTAASGEAAVFPLGFWNGLGGTKSFVLSVDAKNNTAFNDNGGTPGGHISYISDYANLQINERAHSLIAINVPKGTTEGQYAFDISIKYDGDKLYTDRIYRIYVLVSGGGGGIFGGGLKNKFITKDS
ncbi:hypothetical protein ACFLTH_05530 [Bacteroidota bacterium]